MEAAICAHDMNKDMDQIIDVKSSKKLWAQNTDPPYSLDEYEGKEP